MRILFVYSSDRGYVRSWGEKLSQNFPDDFTAVDVKKGGADVMPDNYDAVILASSVHAGSAGKKFKKFCSSNAGMLLSKRIILVLAGLQDNLTDKAFENNFSEALIDRAAGKIWIGGRIDPAQHNFFIRFLMKKISGKSGIISSEKWETVDEAAGILKKMIKENK